MFERKGQKTRPQDRAFKETRRDEVLREALHLVAENGVAGASLRKLARRLGMSQPSLYHYFATKDDLIEQLVDIGARHMVESVDLSQLPRIPLGQLPHVVKDAIFRLWEGEEHAAYTRFLFAVAIESPEHQCIIRRVFEERLQQQPSDELARLFKHDPVFAQHLVDCLTLQARAMGLCLIEDRILFGRDKPSDRTKRHAEFIADLVATSLNRPPTGRL